MLRPIEMLAVTDQDIRNLMPNDEGWIKIKVCSAYIYLLKKIYEINYLIIIFLKKI